LRVLVTGGTGFVGTHLVRFLNSRDSEIYVIASSVGTRPVPEAQYHELDIRDTRKVRSLVRDICPEQIYHLAGITAVGLSWADPRMTYEVNVIGAQNLFDAAMNLPAPPRILNVSTSQVYAQASAILSEDSPVRPTNPYAASKAMAELLVFQYPEHAGGGIITARPFNHTGCEQSSSFVLPSIAKQFAEIESGLRPPKVKLGNIAVRRDFTDVRDVVRAYCMLLNSGRTSEVYNVCSGIPVLLSDIVEMFQTLSGVEATVEMDPDKVRTGEVQEIYGDPGKLRAETGWNREIPLKKTLEDMLNYWRARVRVRDAIPDIQ
jgi:GDP-4-dehydro-6-deoxy-D-mannose reductase